MSLPQWLIVFVSLFLVVRAPDPNEDEEKHMYKCTRLESAISRFFPETKYYINALYESMGYDWDFSKDNPVYDIYESEWDRKAFACKLLMSKSHTDLMRTLNTTIGVEGLLTPIRDIGGVEHLKDFARVLIKLLQWAKRNGYPTLPLHLDESDTRRVLEEVRAARRVEYMQEYINKLPFPLKSKPSVSLKLLKGAKDYSRLESAMNLQTDELKDWAGWIKEEPQAIQLAIDDINNFLDFITLLNGTGYLTENN